MEGVHQSHRGCEREAPLGQRTGLCPTWGLSRGDWAPAGCVHSGNNHLQGVCG